ncbi:hypothetical protein PInf_013528 [Phytophthora infestans]|nr:hypothetical protein PInf_013528 [Phytophthora infestans]
MTATLDHPHIVTFIGVAWESLSDLCVVLELMEGSDLRSLLYKYQASKRPVGFDKQKISIALNVCQALTYLHSLFPPIIHRDLKSRNVLLDGDMKAKLSDFGIFRERLDRTMTACVGTSLWMAPEVMLGERYDVKADMFSFGVVLSELIVHTMPSNLIMGFGYPATGSCVGAYNESDSLYVIANLNENGSALYQEFLARTCFFEQLYMTEHIDANTIAGHSCDVNWFRWYSSNDGESRIPRDKVVTLERISNGAFGVVYAGVYNGREVAIKMLLPASREKLHRVNEFLAEAKMTATMDHPHIVSFVGVAWDSLSDLCVVLEFMGGGELRTLLNKFEEDNHHVGLDRQKLSIALQVCHALSYLHSMMPSVIHRDLKFRNILLDSEMNAKLSDFGISRERLGRTMTAGVGTSLWMAPEVMLGER